MSEGRTSAESENWYVKNKSKIMREMRFASQYFRKHLVQAYGKAEGEAITREALGRFEAQLPDLPDIGGAENVNTRYLYGSAAHMAIYRSLRARGASVEDAARLIYLGASSFHKSFPMRWLMRWQGRRMFSRKRIDQRRRGAATDPRQVPRCGR